MTDIKPIQIFLSYATPDRDRVLQVYDFLINNGYPDAWIDCKNLHPGQLWELEIQRNLRKSEIVLVFLSNISVNKRGFVQRELRTVLKYLEEKLSDDIYIIPIKLDSDTPVPDEISQIQWLDLNSASAMTSLKQSLDKQTQKLGSMPPPTFNESDEIVVGEKYIKESWNGLPGYQFEAAIPLFYSSKFNQLDEVTKIIEAAFILNLHGHRNVKLEQDVENLSWAQDEYARTNTFEAYYEIVYKKTYILSIQYLVSWYGAGAAHPNYYLETFNFLLSPLIYLRSIEDIFSDPESCFDKVATYAKDDLLKQKLARHAEQVKLGNDWEFSEEQELEWINGGIKNWESFSAFSFTENGLEIGFAPYEVGPYAEGSYSVLLPYNFIGKDFKKDIQHALSLRFY